MQSGVAPCMQVPPWTAISTPGLPRCILRMHYAGCVWKHTPCQQASMPLHMSSHALTRTHTPVYGPLGCLLHSLGPYTSHWPPMPPAPQHARPPGTPAHAGAGRSAGAPRTTRQAGLGQQAEVNKEARRMGPALIHMVYRKWCMQLNEFDFV